MTPSSLFSTLASVVTVYSLLCTVRIVLTWIPGLTNGFTIFLSKICDPYLNFFSKSRKFCLGNLDFSPIIALGILAILSTLFQGLSVTGRITLSIVLFLIVKMTWYTASSVLNIITLLLLIRFIVVLVKRSQYTNSPFWSKFDYIVNPFIYKVARFFSGGKMISYRAALLITILCIISVSIILYILISQLGILIMHIPF